MRLTDLMLAFPTVILAMIISAALGAGIRNAVIAIMVAWWPTYARFARGLVLSARDREYVEAARAVGASPVRVFMRHILVNIVSPIVILGTLDVGRAILTFASLSFLGLGPPPQIPEWGSMIAAGRDYLDQWWIATFPGLAILTLVVALNVVGDSLRDTLDPRLRGRPEGPGGERRNFRPRAEEKASGTRSAGYRISDRTFHHSTRRSNGGRMSREQILATLTVERRHLAHPHHRRRGGRPRAPRPDRSHPRQPRVHARGHAVSVQHRGAGRDRASRGAVARAHGVVGRRCATS